MRTSNCDSSVRRWSSLRPRSWARSTSGARESRRVMMVASVKSLSFLPRVYHASVREHPCRRVSCTSGAPNRYDASGMLANSARLPSPASEALPLSRHLARVIESARLETTPFDHVYLRDIFPPGFYQTLLARLPETRRYREMRHRQAIRADGRSARRKFYLFPEHVMLLPREQRAFWLPLARHLRSRELQDAFKHRFRGALERRFGKAVERLSFYPVPMLLRDFGGYRIGIHGDSMRKAITVQLYLPSDASQAHLGTLLHEARTGEAAERVFPLQFLPATGYAFPVMRHESWHSVAATSEADGVRESLMISYMVQDTPGTWLIERLKRLWLFLIYGLRR